MAKKITCGFVVACLLAPLTIAQEPTDVRAFMRAKLAHAQEILKGLTTDDFDAIVKGSSDLTTLSQDTDWNVIQTAGYRQQSDEFRRRTMALTKAGRAKNLDAATLAYVQVTLSCIDCHKYVRGQR